VPLLMLGYTGGLSGTWIGQGDAVDHSGWRKQMGDNWWLGWVMFLLGLAHLGWPGQSPVSRKMVVCMCVCVCACECE